MLKEFKEFALRGNVVDLAIAVVLGGASLVNDIIMPLIGLMLGGIDFQSLQYQVGDAIIKYGAFIQAVVDFVIIAFVIFLIVRAMNRMKKQPAPADPTTKECPHCFTTIPIKATRCPNCTTQL
jgi:large conductance mechanosensitive channel